MAAFTLPRNGLSAIDSMAHIRDQGSLVALGHPTEKRQLWKLETFEKKTSEELRQVWQARGCQKYSFRLPDNIIVLDFDGENAPDRWRDMQRRYRIRNTRIVRTPSGGLHVYLYVPPGQPIRHGVDVLRDHGHPKVDVFSHKSGLITGPGSYRRAGGGKVEGRYAWCTPQEDLAHATEALLELLKPPPERHYEPADWKAYSGDMHPVCQSILDDDLNKLATCTSGSRNKTLYTVSANLYAMAAAGEIPESGLEAMLINAAKANGLADKKDTGIIGVKKTIQSGKKRGWANPRCLASYRENYDRKRASEKRRAVVTNKPVGAGVSGEGA